MVTPIDQRKEYMPLSSIIAYSLQRYSIQVDATIIWFCINGLAINFKIPMQQITQAIVPPGTCVYLGNKLAKLQGRGAGRDVPSPESAPDIYRNTYIVFSGDVSIGIQQLFHYPTVTLNSSGM